MSIRTKGRRKIIVRDQGYVWYIAPDNDSDYHILHIVSDDKYLILSCPVGAETAYVISKGRIFQTKETDGLWNRYLLPFEMPDVITPKYVETLIVWATQNADAKPIPANDVPV